MHTFWHNILDSKFAFCVMVFSLTNHLQTESAIQDEIKKVRMYGLVLGYKRPFPPSSVLLEEKNISNPKTAFFQAALLGTQTINVIQNWPQLTNTANVGPSIVIEEYENQGM